MFVYIIIQLVAFWVDNNFKVSKSFLSEFW